MYKPGYSKIRVLVGITTVSFFIVVYLLIIGLSGSVVHPRFSQEALFYKNIIGSYLFILIPINILSWLCLGRLGGVLIFVFSSLSIISIGLRHAVFCYNGYIFLFGISTLIGYRIFLRQAALRNKYLAKLEVLDAEKNILVTDISKKEKEIASAKNRTLKYKALKDITEELSSTLDLEATAGLITEKAFNIIEGSDRGLLFLINESKQELELFSYRQTAGLPQIGFKKAQLYDTWILRQRRSLIVEDLENDFRFSVEALNDPTEKRFKSIIAAPLHSEMKVIGVLRLASFRKASYTQDDMRLLGIISDLAAVSIENSRLYQRTNELAITDGLTGLYVQRYFKERLAEELKAGFLANQTLSILMFDLDYFKRYNDKYGHTAGDILLGKVALVLKAYVGAGAVVSRYGGEEFAVILPQTDKKRALEIAEDLRKVVEEASFTLRRDIVKLTVSAGVSSFPVDGQTVESLLKKADDNLYEAKERGRNLVWPESFC